LQQRLQPLLDRSFGYHVMQLGPLPGLDLIAGSPINHRIRACAQTHPAAGLRCYSDELPLESDSIDMLVAVHALEFESHPHASLREMQRVLRPHGHLVVIGFNPGSLLGLGLYLRGLRRDPLWSTHKPVSPHRLHDWLRLVDCQLEAIQYLYPLPLFGSGSLRRAIGRFDDWAMRRDLPGGGIYIAHAIKERAAMRPVRPRNRVQSALPGLALVGSPRAARRRDRAA
jgi:SAM-dependent methyltransferase